MRMRMGLVAMATTVGVACVAMSIAAAAPSVRIRSTAASGSAGAGGSSVVTSTYTVAPTTTPVPTRTATAIAPSIYLPVTHRFVTDPTADRVAARLMAMLDRPGERDRLIVWDWEAGVALVALMTAYGDGRDPRVTRWVDGWLARAARDGWVDVHAPALTIPNHVAPVWGALLRDARAGDGRHEALFAATRAWLMGTDGPAGAGRSAGAARVALNNADLGLPGAWPGAWAHLPDRPELWDDTLFMAAPFLARYGQREGDASLVDEAALQVLAHARILADPATGVWRHGWSRTTGDHMSGGRWARGNAWAALATTEVMDSLPATSPLRDALRGVLERQLSGLARLQAPSGLWHTEVTRPDFYTETSGSAGIVAALYRAIAAGWAPASLRPVADRGYDAVRQRIAADGTVTGVSMGTGVPSAAAGIEVYGTIDASRIQPYGQGLALLMFAAREAADAGIAGR